MHVLDHLLAGTPLGRFVGMDALNTPGRTQVIAKTHVPTFDELPSSIAARVVTLGQALARRP